jgi:hypothetical protein
MNKTLIALAIAAALPVAAKADMDLSGSVTTEFVNTGVVETDVALSLSASEVLANGMTATATFDVLSTESQSDSSATLTGDFGTLTAGSIDSDGAFQSGDVGEAVANTEDADESGTTVSGVHFSTTQASLSLAAQVNGTTGPTGAAVDLDVPTRSTQFGATYDFNGLTVGYSYASADADSGADASTAAAKADKSSTVTAGVNAAQTAFGASYTFGDLVVTAGKSSVSDNALVSASYTMVADALTVKVQADNYHSATDNNDYQIDLSYAMTDTLTLSSEIDKNKTTTLVAAYTSGDLTASVSKTDDGTTDASVALDFGNADLTLARNGGDADTSVTYKVAF